MPLLGNTISKQSIPLSVASLYRRIATDSNHNYYGYCYCYINNNNYYIIILYMTHVPMDVNYHRLQCMYL